MTPKTTLGKMLAGIACVTGILLMAMPISVLVETYGEIYTSHIWKSTKRKAESKFGRKNWIKFKKITPSIIEAHNQLNCRCHDNV